MYKFASVYYDIWLLIVLLKVPPFGRDKILNIQTVFDLPSTVKIDTNLFPNTQCMLPDPFPLKLTWLSTRSHACTHRRLYIKSSLPQLFDVPAQYHQHKVCGFHWRGQSKVAWDKNGVQLEGNATSAWFHLTKPNVKPQLLFTEWCRGADYCSFNPELLPGH